MSESSAELNVDGSLDILFEPVQVGKIKFRNRLVMPPMTRYFSEDGKPLHSTIEYYRRRAAGGLGMIITEGVSPRNAVAAVREGVPNFYGSALPVWKETAKAVQAEGCAFIPQLWHSGLGRENSNSTFPDLPSIGPSGFFPGGEIPAREMTQADVDELIDAFATAAVEAHKMGCEGVNVHGAHGYLIDQFLWSRTNLRRDHYNGDVAARTRFAVEIINEIRHRTGPDFIIMFRFSQWKIADYTAKTVESPKELEKFLKPLIDVGVDIFDASTRRFWLPEYEGSDLNLAGWTKKISGKPTMIVGSVSLEAPRRLKARGTETTPRLNLENLAPLCQMLERGEFDLVGVGRAVLANPEWPTLVRERRFSELKPYHPKMLDEHECSNVVV